MNFNVGFDLPNAPSKEYDNVMHALAECGNIWPNFDVISFLVHKHEFYQACAANGIEISPQIHCVGGEWTPQKLLDQMKDRGWDEFYTSSAQPLPFKLVSLPVVLQNRPMTALTLDSSNHPSRSASQIQAY